MSDKKNWTKKEMEESLKLGIEQSLNGETVDLGSFAQYADDVIEEEEED